MTFQNFCQQKIDEGYVLDMTVWRRLIRKLAVERKHEKLLQKDLARIGVFESKFDYPTRPKTQIMILEDFRLAMLGRLKNERVFAYMREEPQYTPMRQRTSQELHGLLGPHLRLYEKDKELQLCTVRKIADWSFCPIRPSVRYPYGYKHEDMWEYLRHLKVAVLAGETEKAKARKRVEEESRRLRPHLVLSTGRAEVCFESAQGGTVVAVEHGDQRTLVKYPKGAKLKELLQQVFPNSAVTRVSLGFDRYNEFVRDFNKGTNNES